MDLGFDLNELHRNASRKAFAGDCLLAPEWHELMPRLFAGWSARREMMRSCKNESLRRGNFDPASAQVLAKIVHDSRAVNQAASGNRKPEGGICIRLAGNFQSGDRG